MKVSCSTFSSSAATLWIPALLLISSCLASAGALQIVYVDESATPSVPCGASADQPCHSLAAAFGVGSHGHHLKSADFEVRIRPGVYRTSENVGFVFIDSSISLKRWPEDIEQRVVFDCEHGPTPFTFKDCSASSLTGVELRNCPAVLVSGTTGFTVTDTHFLYSKGSAVHVMDSELVAERVVVTPNKRTSVRCEGTRTSVVDVDGTLSLSKECTNSENNRLHAERDTRLSAAPQNVAHAAVVLVMFILGLNWILEGLEARW